VPVFSRGAFPGGLEQSSQKNTVHGPPLAPLGKQPGKRGIISGHSLLKPAPMSRSALASSLVLLTDVRLTIGFVRWIIAPAFADFSPVSLVYASSAFRNHPTVVLGLR